MQLKYKSRRAIYWELEQGSEGDSFTINAVPLEDKKNYKPIRQNLKYDAYIIDIRVQRLSSGKYRIQPELHELQQLLNSSKNYLNVQVWCWPENSKYFLAHSGKRVLDSTPVVYLHNYFALLFSYAERWTTFRLYADIFVYNQEMFLGYAGIFRAPNLRSIALQNVGDLIGAGSNLEGSFHKFATTLIARAPRLHEFILIDHTRKLPTNFIRPMLPFSKLSSLRMGNDPTVVEMHQVLCSAPALVQCVVDNLRRSDESEIKGLRIFRCPSLESLTIRYNMETMFRHRPGVDPDTVLMGTPELMKVIRAPRLTKLALWHDERWEENVFRDFVNGSDCKILELELVDTHWLSSALIIYLELCPLLKRFRLSVPGRSHLFSKEIMHRMTWRGQKKLLLPHLEVLEVKDEALDVQFNDPDSQVSAFGIMVESRVKTTPLRKVVIMSRYLKFDNSDEEWHRLWFYKGDAKIMESLHKQGGIEVVLEEYSAYKDFTLVSSVVFQ